MGRIKGQFHTGNTKTHKTCPICNIKKPRSEFGKWKSRADGLTAYCKECYRKKNLKWSKENPDKKPSLDERRDSARKRNFGITGEEYNQMLKDQSNSCAICKIEIGREAHLDHCHSTGKVRGLLCRECNTGLGLVKDDIKIIERAIEYLEKMQ